MSRRIRESGAPGGAGGPAVGNRTVGDLLAGSDGNRQEREQAAARAAYLDGLAGREDELWGRIESLVAVKRQAEYAEAGRLLTSLRDLAARQQKVETFEAQLVVLRARNGKKPSFLDRLKRAGLRPDGVTR